MTALERVADDAVQGSDQRAACCAVLYRARVRRLGIKLEPAQKRPPGAGRAVPWPVRVYLWRSLDASLGRDFGLP